MALSINWATRVINIPLSYLSVVTGTLYKLDTDAFRLDLKGIEASEEGIPFPDTHRHNTEVTVAGTTFVRAIEILPRYSIAFEDGAYSVRLEGSNNNIFDIQEGILNQNQVQVIPTNSAGLLTVQSESMDNPNLLGLGGQNVKWTNMVHDANNNLTSATITHYTDETLTVVSKVWQLTATYDAQGRLTSHQMVEVP